MIRSGRRHSAIVGLAAIAALAVPHLAVAEPVPLTVTMTSFQQIANRPCVIGDPSCNNPGDLPFTQLPPQLAGGAVSSPTYTADQIRSIVGGNTFLVGIDLNQAMGRNGGDYHLLSFTLSVNNAVMFSTIGPATLRPTNPGNGFSDAAILGFDLSGLPGNAPLVFTASFAGGTAGREQFFLRAANLDDTLPTPEPASMLLVASGLVGGVLARRRRKSVKA